MIVVTGAVGFIGSCMIRKLNDHGFNHIIAVDHFQNTAKLKNLTYKQILQRVDRDRFFTWVDENYRHIEFIFHLGARTDTTEPSHAVLAELNTEYSKEVWKKCIAYQIPLVYASSAATYGQGTTGYVDDEQILKNLSPLNPYGQSKHDFDLWAVSQREAPFFWAGLKFFNVYGPNEYHKGRMSSVVYHAFHQISETSSMKLFRSHRPDFIDGGQKRDFIYVKDLVDVLYWLMHHRKNSGIYNLGTGKAETFLELTQHVFAAIGKSSEISFIDTPADIRDKYQYFTEADMTKLRSIGYTKPFKPLLEGVPDYVRNYLMKNLYY